MTQSSKSVKFGGICQIICKARPWNFPQEESFPMTSLLFQLF